MTKIDINEIQNFFEPISTIKLKKRHGWELKGVKDIETIGSHVFGSALIGWYLARKEHLDATRIIKLVLVHELVKAYVPDLTPKDKDYYNVHELELEYLSTFIKNLPKELKNEFISLFHEYRRGGTEEAKLAREADRIDTLQQAVKYQKLIKKPLAREFFNNYQHSFQTKTGIEIFKRLKKANLK